MKKKTIYKCSNCGYETSKWMGCCLQCNEWNTFKEIETKNTKKSSGKLEITRLVDVVSTKSDRIITNINEFNRVMGGGIVKDSISIITARPGAGKSTLLLQVADDVAKSGHKVLYASGEESESQIKKRADRIIKDISKDIWIYADTSMDNVIDTVNEIDPDFIIIDSIQTFVLSQYNNRPGSPIQTMECANELVKLAKNPNRQRAVIIVGQMTKDDELAGVRSLEHLVDTVLIIDGENGEDWRGLLCSKNRFGGTGEMGFFSMSDKGMISIDNPSEYFMTRREKGEGITGSTLTVIREGNRPIIVEIESLVSKSFTPYPSRISDCIKKDQLNTLLSILEQRGGIPLYDKNVVIKTTGGIKLKEQSVNLAVIMSIVSSIKEKEISSEVVFIGDVGLTGEIKKVKSIENRIKELDRMGYKKVYVAPNSVSKDSKFKNIKVIEVRTVKQLIDSFNR